MGRTKQSPSSSASFWRSRSRSASAPATTNRGAAPDDQPLGCMSVVHYLIFAPGAGCVGRPPSSSSSSSDAAAGAAGIVQPRGNYDRDHQRDVVEDKENRGGFHAPRNSLDLDADSPGDVQIGVQIEPVFDALACRMTRAKAATGPPSEAETPRTPSLVARLMGIDGLPDTQEPSPAQQRKNSPAATNREKKKRVIPESVNRARREPLRSLSCNVPSFPTAGEARSLPDTPRASASARASWDGARMSLQALKENMLDRAAQYMSLPTSPTSAGKQNNTKKKKKKPVDARRTAKEIVRQAKEQKRSSTTDEKETVSPVPLLRKDKLLAVGLGHQAPSKPTAVPSPPPPPLAQRTEKRSPLAPRSAALAPKQQPPPPPPQRVKPSRPPPPPPPLGHTPTIRAKKPDGCERFATQVKKPSPAPAPPSAPPSPSTSSSSPSVRGPSSTSRPPSAPLEEDPEHSYLRAVLERGGFMRTSPPSRPFNKRQSVSTAPVDPIVFHLLELELPADDAARLGPLRHRWNRKLMFHLAQEILADLLLEYEHEYIDATSCSRSCPAELRPRGAALLDNVWKRVRCFPTADCRVVGDIDALVATDLDSTRRVRPSLAEETGDVAEEVAEQVLEALLGECVCVAAESVSLSSDSDQVGGGAVTRRDVDTDRTGNRGGAHYHAPPATASIERAESSI